MSNNTYMAYYMKNRYISLKLKAIEYKGGKCVCCGYDKCYAALVFHHRDPEEKEMSWGHLRKRNWEFIKLELDKCDLMCHNCHVEKHFDASIEDRVIEWSNRPKKEKIKGTIGVCKQCGKEFVRGKWDKEKKCCSRECAQRSQERIKWPEADKLRTMVEENGQVQVGKMLGISPNAVKKRLIRYC